MPQPFNSPRLSDRLAAAAAKPAPPVIVHAQQPHPAPSAWYTLRRVAKNKKDYARKRLQDVPHIRGKDLRLEIKKKFGTPLQWRVLTDLRQELGIGLHHARRGRPAQKKVQGAQGPVSSKHVAEPQSAPVGEAQQSLPQQAAEDITVHHALRRVLDHMRERGIERLVLFDTGSYDIHNRQRSVFEPDA